MDLKTIHDYYKEPSCWLIHDYSVINDVPEAGAAPGANKNVQSYQLIAGISGT